MKTAQERDRDQDLVTIKILFLVLRAKTKVAIPNADFRTCHKQQRKNLVQHVHMYTGGNKKGSRASGVKLSLSPERCDLTNMNNYLLFEFIGEVNDMDMEEVFALE